MSDDKLNLSFWAFLAKFQWTDNSKDFEVFKSLPVMDIDGNFITEIATHTNLYYFEQELSEICNSNWMTSGLITILSSQYDSISNATTLFNLFGFKKYEPQKFATFFEDVIVNQDIPESIPSEVSSTNYSVTLDTEEKCMSFHLFMSKKYTLLNDIDKALLKGTPVYVYGREKSRRLEIGCGSYILSDDKFGVLEQCSACLLPEINALDSSYVNEESLPYWRDVMGCVTMDDEILCQWIEQNSGVISQTLQLTNQNISFWTWLFDSVINSQSKIGRLKSLPIILFTARDASNKEENLSVASLSKAEVYMSNSFKVKLK